MDAQCVDIKAMDIDGVVRFSKENSIDLVVVAPDDPLAAGMVDALNQEGIMTFGQEPRMQHRLKPARCSPKT